jgi:ATP-binding cassette subfamily C protein
MVNLVTVQELPGCLYQINGNEPILLNDLKTVWIVQSGSVAVFAVTVHQNQVEGTRRYLFSVEQGGALFGCDRGCEDDQDSSGARQLLAVPMEATKLLQVDRSSFQSWVADGDIRVEQWVGQWLQSLGTLFSEQPTSAIQIRAAGQATLSLSEEQILQPEPGAIVWIKIQQGQVNWLGCSEQCLTSTSELLPLNQAMWLEAEGSVELITQPTHTLKHSQTLLAGLAQLHRQLLYYLLRLEQQELEAELERLQQQAQLNYQVTEAALGELASALGSKATELLHQGDPLLAAAGAVGRALGVPIRPPAQSVDLQRVRNPLEAIVRASRVRMRRILLRENWWQRDGGPLLAYMQADHRPVALLPVSARRYELFDPIEQQRVPMTADRAAALLPVAYMIYRPLPHRMIKAIDLLRFALSGRTRDLLMILLMGVAVTLLGMLTPYATAVLIDNAIPDSDRGLLLQVGAGLLIAAIGTALFQLTQGVALLRLETASDASTQAAVWDRLLNLPVSFFRHYTTGDLQSRVTSISQIRRHLGGTTILKLISALFAFFNLGLLIYYSFKLAFIAVAVAGVSIGVTSVSGLFLLRKIRPLLEIRGSIFGQTVQLINGISKLRVAGAEARAFAFWSQSYSHQIKLELSTQYIEDAVALFNVVVPTLTSAILFWFTVQLLTKAEAAGEVSLSIGTFLAFNTAFGTFIRGATDLSNTVTNALQVFPQWRRAQPILETVPEVDLNKADPGKLKGRITVRHVSFRYRQDGPLILDDVMIQAEPGEFIAIVGGSGSGKSTLFRLLLGFETPETGTIYYDGQDLSGLDVDAVRRQLGVVLQSGRIMSASIFENIASGALITLDEAWEAARMAGIADDIATMPMEMHTVISEGGSNLSGGQRQRLLIARSLALKPRILLFDEATSALDNRTQALVSQSLEQLNVTRIVIAHRLSTIRHADRIYVLQSGCVLQQGTFEELAHQEGLFAQLIARQIA